MKTSYVIKVTITGKNGQTSYYLGKGGYEADSKEYAKALPGWKQTQYAWNYVKQMRDRDYYNRLEGGFHSTHRTRYDIIPRELIDQY